jgi:hypothetical protein
VNPVPKLEEEEEDVLLLKLNIGCERFYLCRLFTIDWS